MIKAMQAIRDYIFRRRQAYRALFLASDGVMGPAAKIVLTDLRKFCRGTSSAAQMSQSGMIDPIATGIAIGRQEVWLRIQQNLHLSDADLYTLVEQSDAERDQ